MGEPRSRLRTALAGGLLKIAIALTLIPLLTNLLFLIAGTFQVKDAARPDARLIGLSSLSIASFNGIIPSPDTHSYLIHLQFFPNAFTYSYPSSPQANTTSGILTSGPTSSFDPFTLIQSLPAVLSLPSSDTRCLDPSLPEKGAECTPFWRAVRRERAYGFRLDGLFAWLAFSMHVLALVVISLVLVAEACIHWRPYWMRCQCWWAWYRRMCPLPKGTRDEIEALDEHVWDGVRVWCYGLVAAYTVLPVLHESFLGLMFCQVMRRLELGLPKGVSVEAKMGRGFLVAGWGCVVVSVVVFLLVCVRWTLTKTDGWMEQQMEPLLAGEGVIEEDA